ncbi:hypothetical protein BFP72_11915 [Reichenbachiella sp. 5M10]|nr:hypothetical protein BFP72_11915 [Reichenbachiella sp. 5M10]
MITLLTFYHAEAQEEVLDETDYNSSKQYNSNGWDMINRQSYGQALEQFNKSIAIYDGNADSYVGRATALMKLNRLSEAETNVEAALALAPGQADMYYLAGNIYFNMEYYIEATNNYSNAIRSNDDSDIPVDLVNCYYNRGNAYFSAGMYRSAINDFSKVIELKEDYMYAYHNRALAYKHRDDLEQACLDFHKAKDLGSTMSQKYIDKYCP